jgi:hypothetical protein
MDTGRYDDVQEQIPDRYDSVFGLGGALGRGREAGILWMDFEYMPADAPPQVVGHTRQRTPTRVGETVCENVLRRNNGSTGGEAVLVESPDRLVAVTRRRDGTVSVSDV